MKRIILSLLLLPICLLAQENTDKSAFRQLYDLLPTPNIYRTASGAPGHGYFQQQADYVIDIVLDDDKQEIHGEEVITYHNNSPDVLTYLWVQLDQNMRHPESITNKIKKDRMKDPMSADAIERMLTVFNGGFNIEGVTRTNGQALPFTINNTMMRVDLAEPLKPGAKFSFKIKWWYRIQERAKFGGRSGYEYFPDENNYLYTVAQFFPRMAVYDDIEGWQHKQFIGTGEFTLPFGNYQVSITVPADHVVSATGTLTNPGAVLTAEQRRRYQQARNSFEEPVMIITPEEAYDTERTRKKGTKTWKFDAKNVRDFAFASSRKFIWDAMGVKMGNRVVMAESLYPKEGNPLWEQYSTKVVAHTLRVYSKYTFDYPYEKAISVHSDRIGMEYPMICFNGGRPESDGTYSEATKYGMISVIIHEVGHNYFPMIVNSDERQWTWMDEGLNTFLQYLTEKEWDLDYPSRRGPPSKMVDYMKGDKSGMVPIMTNSESILQFGNNSYGKPATALNILRETILGRELFDYAFKTYANRWMFRHPSPADFFRTMEDASGTDLDWFWRGWFFTTDHVDISIDQVRYFQPSSMNPLIEKKLESAVEDRYIGVSRNRESIPNPVVETDSTTRDYYNNRNLEEPLPSEMNNFYFVRRQLSESQKEYLGSEQLHFYEVDFSNLGGLIMPVILEFVFEDDETLVEYLPAEIWLKNEKAFTKTFAFTKPVKQIELDPFFETADTERTNNYWPRQMAPSRFRIFRERERQRPDNPMREARQEAKRQELQKQGGN
jgi:hypothetical protein